MLASVGIAAVALIVAFLTFYASVRLMDYWRWWSDAGLGAVIPMFATAILIAIAAASLAVWLIK
ncbi:hypothetical protein VXL47_12070 [Phaeobacter sp. JH20_30]|uniref:Uncharacterized protein n=1 Tax=Phaeobacter inhibens TaxID=221822 RepID=A0ABN5GLK6_9RHOB|nr:MULTISPECIES: hypothetical protein [Phaeobacter]ATF17111.1 hypothetical protein PhaeoP129_00450 [Phaeobacter gallaeciensis]ATF21220.1 hypothetical protein PhaeoP128_00450 [Phaeobacter gallaeciensis]AUQ49913.1 hypothetical protein PhaeoP83_01639 [Phaeobacter inhibens]AUQ94468.1 hypothetical protein PhaeoP66_01686 [Phaeobacter inhibens]AUR19718.1 hypothetical protein PhaeoP80_01639 [Phaeobacter inhibens]